MVSSSSSRSDISSKQQQLTLLLLLLSCGGILAASAAAAAATTSSPSTTNNDGTDNSLLPHLLRRGNKKNDSVSNSIESTEDLPWYHPTRMLVPNESCPTPDTITTLSGVRTGQYGSSTGDCFYMYWDPSKCDLASGNLCPLYVYVDGTEQGANIDDRDTVYMAEMAERGYVAVTVDYDDYTLGYTNGCDGAGGFKDKSKKIFDPQLTGSVINQLCYDVGFEHRNHVPVDCTKGVAVNGWSQGAHVASLAGNYAGPLITAGLFWGNGNFNWACAFGYSTCSLCPTTDVYCMNSENIALSKEKRRNINGVEDSFFGACEDWWGANNRENVIDQLRSISGYSCPYNKDNCFEPNPNKAGYYAIPGKGHDFMNSNPTSQFMNPSTTWGLPLTFDWLAEQGRTGNDSTSSPTKQPSKAPTSDPTSSPTTAAPSKAPTNDPTSSPTKQPSKAPTSDPTSSPTTAAAPGVCSSNSGAAGTPCHESNECQCGGRRLLQHDASENANNDEAEANQQRELAKGGNKPNPPSPTPPVTPSPTSAPSSEVCGCIFPSTPAPAPAPTPQSCSSFTSKNTCNVATGCFTSCFWCDDSEQPTNGKGQCCSGI